MFRAICVFFAILVVPCCFLVGCVLAFGAAYDYPRPEGVAWIFNQLMIFLGPWLGLAVGIVLARGILKE